MDWDGSECLDCGMNWYGKDEWIGMGGFGWMDQDGWIGMKGLGWMYCGKNWDGIRGWMFWDGQVGGGHRKLHVTDSNCEHIEMVAMDLDGLGQIGNVSMLSKGGSWTLTA